MSENKYRNVFVYDWEGNIISEKQWSFFYLTDDGIDAEVLEDDDEIVPPGEYVLLTTDLSARPRILSLEETESKTSFYRDRTRERDPYCLITKICHHAGCFERFEVVHIFPRAHQKEWMEKQFSSKITDPAPDSHVGGPSKIDSIQNTILLKADLHPGWDDYSFGIDPDRNYLVVPFVPGYEDIAGKTLSLDHIQDPDLRPLDDLLRDHFLQGVYSKMKGAGEPSWDYEAMFSPGCFDLSQMDTGGTLEGRDRLELALADRLHTTMVEQELN